MKGIDEAKGSRPYYDRAAASGSYGINSTLNVFLGVAVAGSDPNAIVQCGHFSSSRQYNGPLSFYSGDFYLGLHNKLVAKSGTV
jgi:hypothetical protein